MDKILDTIFHILVVVCSGFVTYDFVQSSLKTGVVNTRYACFTFLILISLIIVTVKHK